MKYFLDTSVLGTRADAVRGSRVHRSDPMCSTRRKHLKRSGKRPAWPKAKTVSGQAKIKYGSGAF